MKMNHKTIIIGQVVFLALVIILLYNFYPKVEFSVNGNIVKFNSVNSNVIIISKNPDFSNPRYINFEKEDTFVQLDPGKYFWKPANNLIKGFKKELEIKSNVGIAIFRNESEIDSEYQSEGNESAKIKNIGNVKINVTKREDGVMVGHIILEPEETKKIEDKGVYEGREK